MSSTRDWRSFLIAALFVALGSALTLALSSSYFLDRTFFAFLLCAVLAATLRDGYLVGVFAACLSLVAYITLFVLPNHLALEDATERSVVLASSTLLIVWLAGSRRIAQQRLARVIADLQTALQEVKTLRGLIPICAGCKKIRNDEEQWVELERYIQEHTDAQFTHGMCRECIQKWYPSVYDKVFPEVRDQ